MFSAPSCFVFQPDEKVNGGFVRVLARIALQARCLMQHEHGTLTESVHDTRVLIKYLRALLWFANPAFSALEMHRAKSQLRKASYLLAAQRELVVMRSVLKRLSQKAANSAYRKALTRIADALHTQQTKTDKPDQSLQQAVAILLKTTNQLERSAKNKFKWPSRSDRVTQAFLATRKSGKQALKGEDAAQFHDWRKKAKRLLYQLQLTQAIPGRRMTRAIKRVDKLQKKLGDYHDCVNAQERLQETIPGEIPALVMRRTLNLLETRKDRLRKQAQKIAKNIQRR